MALAKEIQKARQDIVSDGYEMSVGEIINLYRDKEIFINPSFQRLFRWDPSRKTRFIESLLLGIPVPPIFVYQDKKGVWELIDGLQRLSTIFEFVGILRLPDGVTAEPSVLDGTQFLPSLSDKSWIAPPGHPDREIGAINWHVQRQDGHALSIANWWGWIWFGLCSCEFPLFVTN